MAERRIKLSELQYNLLVLAQTRFDEAVKNTKLAQERLIEVTSLIYEALNITHDGTFKIEANTKELIIDE